MRPKSSKNNKRRRVRSLPPEEKERSEEHRPPAARDHVRNDSARGAQPLLAELEDEPFRARAAQSPVDQLLASARFKWIRVLEASTERTLFRAEEAETETLITVEMLSPRAAADEEQVNLFYLEAEAAAQLQHPHIARSRLAEAFAGTHLRITDHLPGGQTLQELVTLSGWLAPERSAQIIRQTADALEAAHNAGVLHLALQPEVIWLDHTERVLLTGFGIATTAPAHLRQLRAARCAAPYLSPEQLSGETGNVASDIYALGIIFYQLLTDRVPFDSDDLEKLRHAYRVKSPRSPHAFNPDIPVPLAATVQAWLNRDPDVRRRNFQQVAIAPPSALAAEPAPLVPPTCDALPAPLRVTHSLPLGEVADDVKAVVAAPAAWVDDAGTGPVLMPPPWRPPQYHKWLKPPMLTIGGAILCAGLLFLAWRGSRTHNGLSQSAPSNKIGNTPGKTTSEGTNHPMVMSPTAASGAASPAVAHPGQPAINTGTKEQADRNAAEKELIAPPATFNADATNAGNLVLAKPVRRMSPVYPATAQGVTGNVLIEVDLDEQGRVIQARPLSGPQVLRESALTAARQWQFSPALRDGVPVKSQRRITFPYNWTMTQQADSPAVSARKARPAVRPSARTARSGGQRGR